MNTIQLSIGTAKRGLRRSLLLPLLLLAPLAWAQNGTLTLDLQSATAGKVGSLTVTGQSFGNGIALDPASSDAAVAAVGRFQSATLAADRAGTLNAICPTDQAEYADLLETDQDLQMAAQFLQPFTTRSAMREVQFGTYVVVFAVLSGPTVDPFVRNYALKSVNGSMCLTFDLRSDPIYNTTVDLISATLGG